MEKQILRNNLIDRARALPAETRRAQSGAIARAVLGSDVWRRAESVFIYVSTPFEPDTRALFEAAFAAGKRVYAPVCVGDTMFAAPVASFADLVPGRWGIPEPNSAPENAPAIDLTITPCVGASKNGARLGRGAGFYDRFFQGHRTYKLCLCFPSLLTDGIPMGERDVWMDGVMYDNSEFGMRN